MRDVPQAKVDWLLAQGRPADAIALVATAAQAGDPAALYQQAIWKLAGHPLARDLKGARALLRRAADAGEINAAMTEVALTANGTGAPASWAEAVARLRQAAKSHAAARSQSELLDAMSLDAAGSPVTLPAARKVGVRPDVLHFAGLFSPQECLHVAQAAADILAPATVVDPNTGRNVANPVRTSDGAVIGPTRETLVIQALNRRIAAISATDVRQGEALAILRYAPGQEFRPHLDSIAGAGNQRTKTVLVYLNDGFSGGATTFVRSGLSVTPRAGDAIMFDNVGPDGTPDPEAIHAGEPVIRGTKWLATRWIRARPFDVWAGPEAA